MKHSFWLGLASTALICSTALAANHGPKEGTPENFADMKAHALKMMDERAGEEQKLRACITAAADHSALRDCRKNHHSAMKESRMDNMKEFKEKREKFKDGK